MSETLGNYDPNKLITTIGPIIITGYAPGKMIEITPNADANKLKVGSGGAIASARQHDQSAELKIMLLSTSSTNDELDALMKLHEATGITPGPFQVADLLGRTRVFSQFVLLKKRPPLAFSDEIEVREWVFLLPKYSSIVGGSL